VTDAENLPAARLFQRAGFRQVDHFHVWFKGAFGGEFLFAILRREWEERAQGIAR
jgi:RimJ/RimL family protein N-acetyltransferase